MTAELGEPKVVALTIQIDGLTADIEYGVSYEDMNGKLTKTVEVWDGLTQGQKNQFNGILDTIIGML